MSKLPSPLKGEGLFAGARPSVELELGDGGRCDFAITRLDETEAEERAMKEGVTGTGVAGDPWTLKTPSLSSEFQIWRDPAATPPALVCQVGTTKLSYHLRAIEDLAAMLKARGDWMELGNTDEGKPVKDGSVEAWARSETNPVGGYYGLRKGYRGRFANYVTPVLEHLGLVELEHGPKNNRVRAK